MQSLLDYCEANNFRHLLDEWDSSHNYPLTPDKISKGSEKKVWWKCGKGHSWQATVGSRKSGTGCPVCSGKTVIEGENDLATLYPRIASEWHPTQNGDLLPTDVRPGSHMSVWWKCKNGHEWKAVIKSRTQGCGCPICAGKIIVVGENDLFSQYPEVAKTWNYDENGNLLPEHIRWNSTRRIWWKCGKGHIWQARVIDRVKGKGCPVCGGQRVQKGENDFASLYPDVAKEWHPTRNSSLLPDKVSAHSDRKVWWMCQKGHEWQATISSRTGYGTGCPVCGGKKLLEGYNDLASLFPEIAAEWHPTKNGNITPKDVLAGSHKKYWWQDEYGHEWEASADSRTVSKHGCPYCAGQKVLPGFNDLATLEPKIAEQWHPTLNGNLKPDEVMVGSKRKVWWICPEGHVWKSVIYSRSGERKTGCPVCAGKFKKYHSFR